MISEILNLMLVNQRGGFVLIIVMAVLLVGVGGGAYFLGTRNGQPVNNESSQQNNKAPKIVTSGNTLNNQPEEKIYYDASKLLSFKAPLDWKVNSLVVPKGSTIKNPESGYNVSAVGGDIEIINIKKGNDWTITATIKRDFQPKQCGGVSGLTTEKDYEEELNGYTKIPFLGENALRVRLEDGKYWSGADQPSPFPQPIFFQSTLTKFNDPSSTYNGQYISNFPFCYESTEARISINILYLSSTFTEDNIKNKKLDYKVLQEMDKILESFKLSK